MVLLAGGQGSHRPVLEALGTNGHYGLSADQVEAFPQGCPPSFSTAVTLLLASPTKVVSIPDGNGGLYSALARHDLLLAMRSRGLKHLLLYCVDNALVQPADPAFLGYYINWGPRRAAPLDTTISQWLHFAFVKSPSGFTKWAHKGLLSFWGGSEMMNC